MGTMAIPDLFDAYDNAWEAHDKNGDEKLSRTYVLSQIKSVPEKEKGFFAPRFRDIANYLSQGLTVEEVVQKLAKTKGGNLDESEMIVLEERIKYAKVWLENYAPEEYRFEMTKEVPAAAKNLSENQKKYLERVHEIYDKDGDSDPVKLQNSIYLLSQEMGLPAKDAFSAIYLSILGKPNGPRAGVLLSGIGKDKVLERVKEVINI
jgi:lysyl-tRNA synthetase class 1